MEGRLTRIPSVFSGVFAVPLFRTWLPLTALLLALSRRMPPPKQPGQVVLLLTLLLLCSTWYPRQYVGCRAVVEPDPRAAILLGEVLPHCDVIG